MLDVLHAADELDDLVQGAKHVPLSDDAFFDVDSYLAIVEKMRAGSGSITDRERGRPQRPVSDLLDALESLGAQSPKVPLTSRHRINKDEVYDLLDQFRAVITPRLAEHREDELEQITRRVDLADPGAPTLEALLERVATTGERLLISRDGRLLGDLRAPPHAH